MYGGIVVTLFPPVSFEVGSDLLPVQSRFLISFICHFTHCSGGPLFCFCKYSVNKSWFVPTESINYVFNVSVCMCFCLLWKMLNFIFIHLKMSDSLKTNKCLFIQNIYTWLWLMISCFFILKLSPIYFLNVIIFVGNFSRKCFRCPDI